MPYKTPLFGALLALSFATDAAADVEVHDQYARTSNPMAGAAFMMIHNHGGPDDRLLDVTSDVAARTELHTHIETDDGVMQMTHVTDGFDLPADGELSMERGGAHIMFMGLNDQFGSDGDTIAVTLIFEQAGEVVVEIPIDQDREPTGHGGMDHGDMEDGDMDHSTMDH